MQKQTEEGVDIATKSNWRKTVVLYIVCNTIYVLSIVGLVVSIASRCSWVVNLDNDGYFVQYSMVGGLLFAIWGAVVMGKKRRDLVIVVNILSALIVMIAIALTPKLS